MTRIRLPVPSPVVALVLGLATSTASLVAQAANEFDFDTAQLAVTTIPPNGPTHAITASVTYTSQNLVLNTPLVVRKGGELRLVRSILNVQGGVTLEEGSRLTVLDSSLLIANQYQAQNVLRNEGGLLHTERALIGSAPDGTVVYQTHFLHLRGTWLARQTVMQGLVTLMGDGRIGWHGDPRLRGGSIFADGLYEGDRADAIHVNGMGDVVLANGTMNVGFYYDAGTSTQPASATIDLNSRTGQTVVYGDPLIHSGVTAPIPTAPRRLELRNHRSVSWQLIAIDVSSSGPLHTITLRNAEEISSNFKGTDLTGSPVLAGPWSNYYGDLPGLPSTDPPGHHALPPDCSVRLGNVKLQSGAGANDWNSIRSWGLYSVGTGTNLSITGPTMIAELRLADGQLHLNGTGSYEMGVYANVVRLFGNANLQIDNAAVGAFDGIQGGLGLIECNEGGSCSITNARVGPVRFRTTSPTASIWAQNLIGAQNVAIENNAGGSIQVVEATPTQNWDLQNLGFESAVTAGVPPNWAASALNGSLANDSAPGAAGSKSFHLVAQTGPALLRKQLMLSPETFVTVIGAAKVLQQPAGGGQLQLRATHGSNLRSKALGSATNTWQRVHVPLLTIGAATTPTAVEFFAGGLPATVRLDDIRVQIGSWWDNDNLANLDFELGYRFTGQAPWNWTAPDAWHSRQVRCTSDYGIVRPGAPAGSRSMRAESLAESCDVFKDLTFLRAGDTVVVRGWARGVSANTAANIQVTMGDGPNYYMPVGANQNSGLLACNGAWHSFQLTYVVPSNPSVTRLDLGMHDVAGTQFWFDDITVDIQ